MEYLLKVFREWNMELEPIAQYFMDLAMFIWNQYGLFGAGFAIFIILVIGMRSQNFGYFFSLIAVGLVRTAGGSVTFVMKLGQQLLVYFGSNVLQASLREYIEEFQSATNNTANKLRQDRKRRKNEESQF